MCLLFISLNFYIKRFMKIFSAMGIGTVLVIFSPKTSSR